MGMPLEITVYLDIMVMVLELIVDKEVMILQ